MGIRFTPKLGVMNGSLTDAPGFPDDIFSVYLPECIGDTAQITHAARFGQIDWLQRSDSVWTCAARAPSEASYRLTLTLGEDSVDVHILLSNESDRTWEQSMAFNCFAHDRAPSVRDFELVRHRLRTGSKFKHVHSLPRAFSKRPGVQVLAVEGAPPIGAIPYAASFQATPDVVAEGWLAVLAHDREHLVAVVSKPTLFLFQNSEFSCIHSAPSFGRLAPGEHAEALTRIYLVEDSLEHWHARMLLELGD